MFLWYRATWVIVNGGLLDGLLYVSNDDCIRVTVVRAVFTDMCHP